MMPNSCPVLCAQFFCNQNVLLKFICLEQSGACFLYYVIMILSYANEVNEVNEVLFSCSPKYKVKETIKVVYIDRVRINNTY